MSQPLIIIAAILFLSVLFFVILYNSLVGKKNEVENSFAGMDVQLKKRYDLIPNLVEAVKQYMGHEKEILTKLTELRAKAIATDDSNEQIGLDNQITKSLGGLMVSVENYPDLKANTNFLNLQRSLNEVESQIAAARRYFNSAVTEYNNAVEMIPTSIIAGMMNYKRKELFVIEEAQRENVEVKNLFSNK